MTKKEFISAVIRIACDRGYKIEIDSRTGNNQIDFGNKKLHVGHLEKLYPEILSAGVYMPSLINKVAPGRPWTHRPMKQIIEQIILERNTMSRSE